MKWLVTGGAGYIGAHVCHSLRRASHDVVVLDDFSTGRVEFLPEGVELVRGSVLDPAVLDDALSRGVAGVIHIAGYKYAGESVKLPLHTYEQNVVGMLRLLEAMARHSVTTILFSSSAAVYGEVKTEVISEDHPTAPASPYGESKLIGEWMLANQSVATGLRHSSLRYFNVVGSGVAGIYDTSPYSLSSLMFGALLRGEAPTIFGSDYPTRDGTCVRDYIHVQALADAHVAAAERMALGESVEPAYNLGSGRGHSVREVMTAVARITGHPFEPVMADRRPGDPPYVVASGDRAERDLGWEMTHSLEEMFGSAWREYAVAHGLT